MPTTAPAEQSPSTPEKIWATLDRIAARQGEFELKAAARWEEDTKRWKVEAEQREAEAARREAEAAKREAEDARLKEMFEETGRQFKETKELFDKGRQEMGDLRNSFGELAEHLVAPGIKDRFRELGFSFDMVSPNVQIIENGKVITEADLVLENLDCIIVVEVKAKPKIKDVKTHERRLERMRGWHDRKGDRRRILGVMAGAVFGSQEREAALESGLYVIVQSGDTMKLEIPEDFAPREW